MTAREVIWTQDGEYAAQEMRLALAAIFGGRWPTDLSPAGPLVSAGGGHGVVGAGDLLVEENGTPNMSVNVAAGVAIVRGTDQGDQGVYVVANDAPVNLAVTTADATNPRIDLVVAEVEDTEYGGGTSQLNLRVVAGTPASVPSAPTVPDSTLVLAEVSVPASDTAITDDQITDLRTRAYALGATAVCASSATYPSPAVEGQQVYDLSLHQFLVYNGSSWSLPVTPGMELIEEIEVSGSAAASIDFDNIPQTFRHLKIAASLIGTTTVQTLRAHFNNDTSSGPYDAQLLQAIDTAASAAANEDASQATLGSVAQFYPAALELSLHNYRHASYVAWSSVSGYMPVATSTGGRQMHSTGIWAGGGAVNRITLSAESGNLAIGSVASLYGLR